MDSIGISRRDTNRKRVYTGTAQDTSNRDRK